MNSTISKSVPFMLFLMLILGTTSTAFSQSTQQITNKLNVYEDKVDDLDDLVDQATALYNAIMTQVATNSNCNVSGQYCQLQTLVNRLNGPLTVMKVMSDQLSYAGLSMGTGAASSERYTLQQAISSNSSLAARSSTTTTSLAPIGDSLDEMTRIIDGCIRREIQEVRQNL